MDEEVLERRHINIQAVLQCLRHWRFEASARCLENESGVAAIPHFFDLASSLLGARWNEDSLVDEEALASHLLRGQPVLEAAMETLRDKASQLLLNAESGVTAEDASLKTRKEDPCLGVDTSQLDSVWRDFDAKQSSPACCRPVTDSLSAERASPVYKVSDNILCGCFLDSCSVLPEASEVSPVFFAFGRASKVVEVIKIECFSSYPQEAHKEQGAVQTPERPSYPRVTPVASWPNCPAAPVSLASTSVSLRPPQGQGESCSVAGRKASAFFAAGFLDGSLWLVEVSVKALPKDVELEGIVRAQKKPHIKALVQLSFSPSGERLVSIGRDGVLNVFALELSPVGISQIFSHCFGNRVCSAVCFMPSASASCSSSCSSSSLPCSDEEGPEGALAVSLYESPSIACLDVHSFRRSQRVFHLEPLFGSAFHRKKRLSSCDEASAGSSVLAMRASFVRHILFAFLSTGIVVAFDAHSTQQLRRFEAPGVGPFSHPLLELSPNEDCLYVTAEEELESPVLVYALGSVKAGVSPDSAEAAPCCRREALAVLRGASRSLRVLTAHPRAGLLAAAGFDKAVYLFR